MNNKQSFMTSIISKLKGKETSLNKTLLSRISNVKYKYTLFKAKDDGCFHKEYANKFDLIYTQEMYKFHIADDTLARALYIILNNKEIELQSIPDEFKSIKFVIVEKLQKVVFVTLDENSQDMKNMTEESYENSIKVLENIHNILSWLSEHFTYEDKNIIVDYKKFFKCLIEGSCNALVSLFGAIGVSDTKYVLTYGDLEFVINEILWLGSANSRTSLDNLKQEINVCNTPFYYFINKGIYMKDMDEMGLYNLPYHLCINIFRYIMNRKCFANPEDFFVKDSIIKVEGNSNVIFDENLFKKSVKYARETHEFEIYESHVTILALHYCPTFLRIKNKEYFSKIEEVVNLLLNEGLINDVAFVYSPFTNEYYLCDYRQKTNNITIQEYMDEVGNDEEKISLLLESLNSLFFPAAVVRKSLSIRADLNLINVVYIDKETQSLNLGDLSVISCSNKEAQTLFQYPLCIMQIIQKFVKDNNIAVDEIYKCCFIKLFPKVFVDEIITFLSCNEHKANGMIGKLTGFLGGEYAKKIEFLENISTSDQDLLQRITFLPNIQTNALIEKFKNILFTPQSTKCVEYVSLDQSIEFVAKHEELSVSKKLLDKIFFDVNEEAFLIPERLIISKDVFDDKNYSVIGVIWNKSKLYRLSDLIQNKYISTKNIYQVLLHKIIYLYEKGYCVDILKQGLGSLLLDDSYNVFIDCAACNSLSQVCRENRKALKPYYTEIINQITNEFGEILENFTCFSFNELACEDPNGIVLNFLGGIKFCTEHQRLYLNGDMCQECQKIYSLKALGEDEIEICDTVLGETRFVRFLSELDNEFHDEYGMIWEREEATKDPLFLERVKLGLNYGIYDKFPILTPRKIIIKEYVKNKQVLGILYDYYDFSGMMSIESFKYIQRIKVVFMLYKKILPYILDCSFLTDDPSVFSEMFMDKEYKGEIISPNLPLLKCEISLSGDEDKKQTQKQKTLKLFSDFIYHYITSDDSLHLEYTKGDKYLLKIIKSVKECDFKEEYIREYLNSKDAYCSAHDMYFSSCHKICPECIVQGISPGRAEVYFQNYFDTLTADAFMYEGGEAKLYLSKKGKIDKIFNDEVDLSFKAKVIGKALQKAKALREFNESHTDIKFVTIDKVLYSYKNSVLTLMGYRQNYVKDSFKISSLKEKGFAEKMGYDRKDILGILIKVCIGIEYLHSIGVFIGDLNGGNILIKGKSVYFIDMDGMSYDDVRNFMYTNTYIYPPSVENKNISALDDWYSLAVQSFYYLTYSHPFRGICSRSNIPENEVERMKHGLSVLGKHEIEPPNISIGWDFLPSSMIDFFLQTFEGKRRESMREILQEYLNSIKKEDMRFKEIVRKHGVALAVSENVYIDTSNILYYKEEAKIKVELDDSASNCMWSDDDCSVIDCVSNTVVINNRTGNVYVFNKTYEWIEYAHNNKIYYTNEDGTEIYVDEVNTDTNEIRTYILTRNSSNAIWCLSGEGNDNDKFVMLECNNKYNTFDIYCNTILVYSISQADFTGDEFAEILHDEVTDNWLVVMGRKGKLFGVTISKEGTCSEFYLDVHFPKSFSFYKNTLYFTGDKKIYMYNTTNKKLKEISCNYVTAESGIERVDNKFIITNEKKSYVYIKS